MNDEALAALLARYRSAEIDQTYAAAYADNPISEPDEWGDLASFRKAARQICQALEVAVDCG